MLVFKGCYRGKGRKSDGALRIRIQVTDSDVLDQEVEAKHRALFPDEISAFEASEKLEPTPAAPKVEMKPEPAPEPKPEPKPADLEPAALVTAPEDLAPFTKKPGKK